MTNLQRIFLMLSALALSWGAARSEECVESCCEPAVAKGDTVVMIGDSITEQAFRNPWGFYHVLTNAAPEINFIPLGFSGFQVKDWLKWERASVTNANLQTWYRDPGWNLKTVFDGKVDAIVIFLGMNDILQPSIRDDAADVARWLYDYATFARNLRERSHPRTMLFATVTPLTADPASPKNRVREKLNNRLRMLAAMTGAGVVEYGEAISDGIELYRGVDPDYRLVPDFVHPNALGHLRLASQLCAALGLESAEGAVDERLQDLESELFERNDDRLALTVALDRCCRPEDSELVYDLRYALAGFLEIQSEVRVLVPPGWSVEPPQRIGGGGAFRLRGAPTARKTRIVVEAVVPRWDEGSDRPSGVGMLRAFVDIPAPWKLRDESGVWKAYSASNDYTGGAEPGSVDPFQTYFGWKTNTITAARRVWSEKARDVKAVLSHQTFSATLDLAVKLNGREVWKDSLDRHGRKRVEKTLHLDEGWNAVEIVCTNRDWQRQFAFDLLPLDGDDLGKLKYDLK